MDLLRLFGEISESIADGPGIRYAIFTQGCPHYCEGCHNPESHSFTEGYLVEPSLVLDKILNNPLLDGITLSGGEPFMQAEDLAWLAQRAKAKNLHVIVFSGFSFEELIQKSQLKAEIKMLLEATDILIDGKFDLHLKTLDLRFRGSSNQRIIDVPQSLQTHQVVLKDI